MIPQDGLTDVRRRFLLPQWEARLVYVELTQVWRAVVGQRAYPPVLQRWLAEALAVVAILAATLKVSGSVLTLQIRGQGAVTLLSAQARLEGLRGLVRWQYEPDTEDLAQAFGAGAVLAITLETPEAPPYQSIVALEGASLAQVLEGYFQQSEQLPTRLLIAQDAKHVVAVLVQRLPVVPDTVLWERLNAQMSAWTPALLLSNTPLELLPALFGEVRWLEDTPLAFACTCSRDKAKAALQSLGSEELRQLFLEAAEQTVDCQFCGAVYRFSAADLAQGTAHDAF